MHFAIRELELPVRLRTDHPMTDEELMRFSAVNDALRIEQESNGDLLIMSPTGGEGGGANADLTADLMIWARQDGRGKVFDSNTGFRMPDDSVRSPDASWVSWFRWNSLTRDQQRRFPPLCPEFVVELLSPTDSLSDLQAKMKAWLHQGAELAWLIDPDRKIVEVYRPGQESEVVKGASAVEGEGPVAGFILDLARIWA